MSTVEDYIYSREDNQQDLLFYFHNLLTSFPGVTSKIRFRIPFYYQKTWVCYLNPLKNGGISLCFLRGYELSNDQGLLESKDRKQVKSIDFSSVENIPEKKVREIINEALLLDEMVPYKPKGKKAEQ